MTVPAPRRRPRHPAQRALVAVVMTLATLLLVAPLLVWPTLEIATSRTATIRLGGTPVEVTVADTPLRRAFGLQGRRELENGQGMLFVFDPPSSQTFERKTVPFALEVVFVTKDGDVAGVSPLDEAHPEAVSPGRILYAVELPLGWCARNEVAEGSRLTSPGQW